MEQMYRLFTFCFALLSCCGLYGHNFYKNPKPLHFENTLLIINYNHPYYQTIPFLEKIYSPVFPHIVFYGENSHHQVIAIDHNKGFWGHNVIADAMIRFPDFDGYICIQDDCLMNFWNFARLDKNKIWFNPFTIIPRDTAYSSWQWWNTPYGKKALNQALDKLPASSLQRLESNIGKNNIGYGWSDFVYIPARLASKYIELCDCFNNPQVFVELAIPNILLCLDEKKNKWEELFALWGLSCFEDYSPNYDWVHPFKFSQLPIQNFVENILSKWEPMHE